ncbi:hypothetical protein, partial [Endozoicomonas sp. ONNA2]|uniref:hypothetical protein n=1 Tax=Endozoicomonas sp. ONNA2 TaxID=2828741 RepID=UPI00214952C4
HSGLLPSGKGSQNITANSGQKIPGRIMIAVDTNVLLRYLLAPIDARNPPWQARVAAETINFAGHVFRFFPFIC